MKSIVVGVAAAALTVAAGARAQDAFGYAAQNLDEPRIVDVQLMGAGGSYLGVGVAEITAERAKALKLKEERGVEITMVQDNSPASKAGLKVGDVVLEYNGGRVEGTAQFMRVVRETPPDRQVRLVVSRDGTNQTLTATIEKRRGMSTGVMPMPGLDKEALRRDMERAREELRELRVPDVPRAYMSWQSGMLGVEAESLTPQLAEFFGVKDGVLVRSVGKDTAAEKAGIKAGDVITKVDEGKVTAPRDITGAIRSLKEKKTFPVTVVRNRKETTLSVTLEQPARTPPRPPGPARDIKL